MVFLYLHAYMLPTTSHVLCGSQVRAIPLDRLLLESDSPDGALRLSHAWLEALPQLAHLPDEVRRAEMQDVNRPRVLRWMLQLVAAAQDKPEDKVAAATYANAERIFCHVAPDNPPESRD
jgi:Tat protein secretion system quality control protein TatD with DNase activity